MNAARSRSSVSTNLSASPSVLPWETSAVFFLLGKRTKRSAKCHRGPQELLRSSSHDDTIPRGRGLFDDLLRDSDDAVGVEGLNWRTRATLVASKNEGLEQTIIKRVVAFFTCLNCGLLTVRESGDLLCQQLVPKFPTQLGGKLFGDFRCSRSVFPLDSDDSDHDLRPS